MYLTVMRTTRTSQKHFILINISLLSYICTCFGSPPISKLEKLTVHMSDCERSLHTNCVVKQGSYKLLVEECNEKFILTCLNEHLTKSICSKNDPDTLSTIKELIKQVRRRFITNKKCANNIFMNSINYHFLVQGEGIEFTAPKSHGTADTGSGSGEPYDDTEGDDENTDGSIDENDIAKNDNSENENNNNNNSNNNKQKMTTDMNNSDFWKKLQQNKIQHWNRGGPLLVFFDDPKKYREIKKREQENISNSLKKEWKNIQRDYDRWYRRSKYYGG